MIFAITDERNAPPGAMAPLMVGLIVVAIGMAFGGMHGYAINPARDFGPRLFTVVAGFKNNGLSDGSLVGAKISGRVSASAIRRGFAAMMLVAAVFMLGKAVLH